MKTATIVSVTASGELELPTEIKAELKAGEEYFVWKSDDSIFIQKVKKPSRLDEILQSPDMLETDEGWMSEEEVVAEIKAYRREQREAKVMNPE
jgi:hypothetical protein